MTFHVEQYLSQIAGFLRQNGGKAAERYMSTEEFVLTYGRKWTWRPSDQAPRLEPKHCFYNAGKLAMLRKDLTYVEGFFWRGTLPIPIHHAWLITPEGFVIDPTIQENAAYDAEGREYWGVPFSTTFVRRSWKGRSTCSILEHPERDYPILERTFVYVKRVHEERLSREITDEREARKA
jgi:hypothetical protein